MQTGKLWSEDVNESETYQNNRRSGWQYDAAGNVLSDGVIPFQYDAAGRNVSVGSGFDISTEAFDGDGLGVRRDPLAPSHVPNDSPPIFYMRSTVLGGKVVAEINGMASGAIWTIPRGGKLQSYVYHGESMVAVQDMIGTSPPTQRLEWRQVDPVSGTQLHGTIEGGDFMLRRSEPDPQGVHVGFADPSTIPPPPPEATQPSYFGGGGSWTRFTLDGINIDTSFAMEILRGDSAVVAPRQETITIIRNGKPHLARWQAYADGYQGYVPVGAKYLGNGQIGSTGGVVFTGAGGVTIRTSSTKQGDTDLASLNGATGEEMLGRSSRFGFAFGPQAQRQQGSVQKSTTTPTSPQNPICYITVVARKIEQLNTTKSPFKGVGMNAYHFYVLTKQSDQNYEIIHHGFPQGTQLVANSGKFGDMSDRTYWDYADTQKVGSLGSVRETDEINESCARIRQNFSATQTAINNANFTYTLWGTNSNAVAYTFLAGLDEDLASSMRVKMGVKLGLFSLLPTHVEIWLPPFGTAIPKAPGWGNNLFK